MKGFFLIGATVLFAGIVSAYVDYHLKCSKNELGIRWPSYHSNSDYYVCQHENGQQATMTCNPGEVFTFVLQMCTSPAKFIPPPPMDRLLKSQNSQTTSLNENIGQGTVNKPMDLTPLIPMDLPSSYPINPTAVGDENIHPNREQPSIHLPNIDESKFPDVFQNSPESKEENIETTVPVLPGKPPVPSPAKPQVPLPPTPAPTPPVMKPTPPGKTTEKKKPPIPQNASKKPAAPKLNKKNTSKIPKTIKKGLNNSPA